MKPDDVITVRGSKLTKSPTEIPKLFVSSSDVVTSSTLIFHMLLVSSYFMIIFIYMNTCFMQTNLPVYI